MGIWPACLLASQSAPTLEQILSRLDRLERENAALRDEVRALRQEVRGEQGATLEERVAITERRTEEQAQTKVEASQRMPIRITGMALVNAFVNSRQNGGSDNPTIASTTRGAAIGGGTLRQSMIGFAYEGPATFLGGHVSGSLNLDFFGGTNQPLNLLPRIRTASVELDWGRRSLMVGQEKPIFAPRDPTSLAQVGVSPLTGAGNLWLWSPQIRYEERFSLAEQTQFKAQVGVYQTSENAAIVPAAFAGSLARYRPGYQGRFEIAHSLANGGRIEIAPGFHLSSTHVAATSVPSRLVSLDWLISPISRVEFTGTVFTGKNLALFGTGGIRQGFFVNGAGDVDAIRAQGGWAQLKLTATDRLSFHLMGGQHDDRNRDLRGTGIGRNQAYGGNFFYRLAPNVIFSLEMLRLRTQYLGQGNRLNNHYDASVAYLF